MLKRSKSMSGSVWHVHVAAGRSHFETLCQDATDPKQLAAAVREAAVQWYAKVFTEKKALAMAKRLLKDEFYEPAASEFGLAVDLPKAWQSSSSATEKVLVHFLENFCYIDYVNGNYLKKN